MTHPNVIPLTPAPGPRANSKPTPRHGEVLPSPWVMPHHVLVKVEGEVFPNGQPKVAWVPKSLAKLPTRIKKIPSRSQPETS